MVLEMILMKINTKKGSDEKRIARTPGLMSIVIIASLLACILIVTPVSAADLKFSGKVTEYVTDTTSVPVAGMRVVLNTDIGAGGIGIGKLDDTYTDTNGEYQLLFPSSMDSTHSNARIEIDISRSGYIVKDVQSNGATSKGGKGSDTSATIEYSQPLFGKDFTSNNFVLERSSKALPAGTVLIALGSIQGSTGTAQVPLSVTGADSIGNMDIVVDDSACTGLKYTGAIPGSLTQNSLVSAKDNGPVVNIGIVDSKGITGDGSVMYLKYSISPDAPACSLILKTVSGNKLDGSKIKFATSDGKFSTGALQGDCNKDGILNSVDALIAVQMSTGEISPDLVADMNGDGKVTSFDASQILKATGKSRLTTLQRNSRGLVEKPDIGTSAVRGRGVS
jgi:hypothetical protein